MAKSHDDERNPQSVDKLYTKEWSELATRRRGMIEIERKRERERMKRREGSKREEGNDGVDAAKEAPLSLESETHQLHPTVFLFLYSIEHPVKKVLLQCSNCLPDPIRRNPNEGQSQSVWRRKGFENGIGMVRARWSGFEWARTRTREVDRDL